MKEYFRVEDALSELDIDDVKREITNLYDALCSGIFCEGEYILFKAEGMVFKIKAVLEDEYD